MKMLRLIAVCSAAALAACATATPYQPMKDGRGYAEQRLETNRFKVTFAGNALTPKQKVENYLLYRAAEVTLANGYDYFVLVQQGTDSETRYSQTFSGFTNFGFYSWTPRAVGLGAGVGTAVPSTEYEAEANILMYKGKKPDNETRAFDARDLKQNLENGIERPKP